MRSPSPLPDVADPAGEEMDPADDREGEIGEAEGDDERPRVVAFGYLPDAVNGALVAECVSEQASA